MPKAIVEASRYHDFSYGHRVFGHENVCAHLHGHNGRVHFFCRGEQDVVGRVIDFKVIKTALCDWVEENWDHRFLVMREDPWYEPLRRTDWTVLGLDFNPTAENLALHLLHVIGPLRLYGTGVTLWKVGFDETRKCGAVVTLTE